MKNDKVKPICDECDKIAAFRIRVETNHDLVGEDPEDRPNITDVNQAVTNWCVTSLIGKEKDGDPVVIASGYEDLTGDEFDICVCDKCINGWAKFYGFS
jgi:hypothetical protein